MEPAEGPDYNEDDVCGWSCEVSSCDMRWRRSSTLEDMERWEAVSLAIASSKWSEDEEDVLERVAPAMAMKAPMIHLDFEDQVPSQN